MRTDSLVERLSQELRPVRRRGVPREVLLLVRLAVLEVAVFLGLGFMRPDMPMAMEVPSFWWKLASMGLIAVLGGAVAILSVDPVRSPRAGLLWLLVCFVAIVASGWLIDASGAGLSDLVRRLDWRHGLQCVWQMIALSIPPAVALGMVLRRGAPTDRGGTALAAALSSATWGAFVFVFACPSDDPFYIAVWYTVGCSIVTILGRPILVRESRW
jgi:hypothetical protein